MLYHTKRFALMAAVAPVALLASPSIAQTAASDTPDTETMDDDLHDRRIGQSGTIVVTAPGLEELDVVSGTSVVEGRELQREMDGQIGEILAKQPGVSATSFAPGASRPILRGFEGERVKVLIDGIGAIDVSNTSADHAVSVEPLTIERVEILRGPAVLLYGGQAIGGAVNIIDKRIPRRRVTEPFHLDGLFEADVARNLVAGSVSLDVPLGQSIVIHGDATYRDTDDIEIPGFSLSPDLRADLLADAAEEEAEGEFGEAEELRETANQQDILPNSYSQTFSANGGATFFSGDSNLGFSAGVYDTLYGVPGRPGTGHGHGEEEGGEEGGGEEEEEEGEERVSIDLRQFRADMRGELDLGDGFFSMLRTRIGYSDYTHTEFEGEEVGTVFDVEGVEGRVELVNQSGALSGAIGAQYYFRDFEAIGAEAFVAPNRTSQLAAFAVQEYDLGTVQFEGAARYETVDVVAPTLGFERDFDLLSGALSAIYQPGGDDGIRLGVTGSRAERAPGGEELYANGPHIATQTFEIGDPDLETESAYGVEGFVRGQVGPATVSFSVYQNWFENYIYLQPTGEEEDDLPVFQFLQQDADYFGLEGAVTFPLFQNDGFAVSADIRGDYIQAELDDGSPVPRIPPMSLLGALEAQAGQVDGRVEVQYFAEQDEVAQFETTTDSFTLVNASIGFNPIRGNDSLRVILKGENLFDVTGRRHASFTKDFVPFTGRNVKLSARVSF